MLISNQTLTVWPSSASAWQGHTSKTARLCYLTPNQWWDRETPSPAGRVWQPQAYKTTSQLPHCLRSTKWDPSTKQPSFREPSLVCILRCCSICHARGKCSPALGFGSLKRSSRKKSLFMQKLQACQSHCQIGLPWGGMVVNIHCLVAQTLLLPPSQPKSMIKLQLT